ncbi:MAG: hypothetical protein RIS70_3852 [Planctomycetota bacterium]
MTIDQFADAKTSYDRDGFVVIRQFLDPASLAVLQGELDRYIREVVPTLPETAAFYQDRAKPETLKQMQHMHEDPFFRDYVHHPQWRQLAETLIGEPTNCDSPEWFNKPPGTNHPTPAHQDNYYFCLEPPNVVTIWLALDRVDDENGCLRYQPGSHGKGIRRHARSNVLGFSQAIADYSDADRQQEFAVHLEPGDAVAHHGNTIHRADSNQSIDRHRRAFAMVFQGISCKRDPQAFQRYQQALQRQHEMLGLQTAHDPAS